MKNNKKRKIVIIVISSIVLLIILLIVISKTNLRKLFSNVTGNVGYESKEIEYNNQNSEIEAENMQDAIDELYTKCLELKNKCPDNYECIKKENIDKKQELKKLVEELNKKLEEEKDEEKKTKITELINESRTIIYDDNYEKMEGVITKIKEL